jgi:hypothetical protein
MLPSITIDVNARGQSMMPRKQAAQLKPGDKVRALVAGCGDVDGCDDLQHFGVGEILTVFRIDEYGPPQGLAITVYADNSVVNVFDEADRGGEFPFEPVA